ncbi:TetR/AcrR family transcriptional regulator [Desulfitobacterium chlororespirans]|uniref:Transcriptional regulator, TetR family n=1 Tax=Desulfitobacterium chlororespirans DSM 11544 TaxID=1121395 RepID=A0A1M7TIJ9_9FIRM|nr:TetR/AcrR family transcriptional regulator [Desulfitobacterium chlororespirans]SHN70547.1 transcriptional regulator, TetR family [Desulfitobacterium chlororespirans DSM 11544]
MARQIEGVYEKVLACARLEFLDKGFKDASLRTIAQNADTSTGSIYTRFTDKEGLFKALVLPAVNGLKEWFHAEQEVFAQFPADQQKSDAFAYSDDKYIFFVDYIYTHFDEFKLLVNCAEGTTFADFIHDIVEIDVAYTLQYIQSTGNDALTAGRATPEFLHILSSAFFSGIFEVVTHDMTKEAAYSHVSRLRRFFRGGWETILKP